MLTTKRRPDAVGSILVEEFMEPMGLTQLALARAMGVQRKHVNELCNGRRNVTASTALILARVFGNSAEFWLNLQRQQDLWDALNDPQQQRRIARARPLSRVTARAAHATTAGKVAYQPSQARRRAAPADALARRRPTVGR